MIAVTASIVVYKSHPDELAELFGALHGAGVVEWIVVDNSAQEEPTLGAQLRSAVLAAGGTYLATSQNVGFGAGHNLAMTSLRTPSEFHVMLNPDILFEPQVLQVLAQEISDRKDVGMIMPKVLYADGQFQPVCKLLPTPADFFLRRFAPSPVKRLFRRRLVRYELEGIENIECDKVPFLSGCFLFTRRAVVDAIGGFDDRFFLYLEDVDFCRRMSQNSKLLYWPHASVVHICYRGAYRSTKLMALFLRSSVAYFTKWGWFFDRYRRVANQAALSCICKQ